VQSFVQTTADALQPSSPLPLRMCACRAIAAFCPRLGINAPSHESTPVESHTKMRETHIIPCLSFPGTDVLAKSTFGVTIITQLVGLILRCSPETMHIAIEALTVVVRHSGNSCVAVESKLSPLVRVLYLLSFFLSYRHFFPSSFLTSISSFLFFLTSFLLSFFLSFVCLLLLSIHDIYMCRLILSAVKVVALWIKTPQVFRLPNRDCDHFLLGGGSVFHNKT
jgi:hypothetical protein